MSGGKQESVERANGNIMPETEMLPVLKGHVFFAEVEAGIYFNGGSERTFVLQGKGLYPLVSKLIAAMNGKVGAGQLAASLPPHIQPLLWKLLGELSSRNLLIDARGADALLPQSYRDAFGETIGYFRDNVPDFAPAFLRWRETPVLAAGSGHVLKSLVRALARLGIRNLWVLDDGSAPAGPDLAEIQAALAEHGELDVEFRFTMLDGADDLGLCPPNARIVYGSDVVDASGTESIIRRLLAKEHCRFIAGGVLDGEGFVGPESFEGMSSLLDLADRMRPRAAHLPHSLMSRSVIGNLLALETMRSEIGLPRGGKKGARALLRNWALHISPGPEIMLRPVFPVPSGEVGHAEPETLNIPSELPSDREPTEFELLSSRLAALFDTHTGLFSSEPGRDVCQLPLAHEAIEIIWPRSFDREPQTVTAWGLNAGDAAKRATLEAISLYAAGVEDSLHLSRPGMLITAGDEGEWRALALVGAVTGEAGLAAEILVYPLSADSIRLRAGKAANDAEGVRKLSEVRDAKTLLRLVQLYDPVPPEMLLGRFGASGPFLCAAKAGGLSAGGRGSSAGTAIIECLGSLCSRLQLTTPGEAEEFPAWTSRPRGNDDFSWDDSEGSGDSATLQTWIEQRGYRVRERPFRADAVLAAYGLGIGSISLEAA
jgi:hypothetical protein